MLKGVNRQVLEVSQPESRYFERILFIVKPEFTALSSAKLMKEAQAQIKTNASLPPKMRAEELRRKGLYAAVVLLATALSGTVIALVLK